MFHVLANRAGKRQLCFMRTVKQQKFLMTTREAAKKLEAF